MFRTDECNIVSHILKRIIVLKNGLVNDKNIFIHYN